MSAVNSDDDIDALLKKTAALKQKAINTFSLKGRRGVYNAAGVFINRPDTIIAAGRKPKPYASYIKEEVKENTEEVSAVPYAATKIAANKSLKSLKLRKELFIPLELEGLSEWLKQQETYLDNLPVRDLEILRSYTSHGDIMVNGFCRGNLYDIKNLFEASLLSDESVPLAYSLYDQYNEYSKKIKMPKRSEFIDEDGELNMHTARNTIASNIEFFRIPKNISSLLSQYKTDLTRIISGSPRPKKPLVVYRGIQSEAHVKSARYRNIDFMSTTLDPFSVLEFTEEFMDDKLAAKFYCCVYEMTLDKDVPCMYMQFISNYANEFEVLLPPGMDIELSNTVQVRQKPADRTAKVPAILTGYTKERVLVVSATVSKPAPKRSMAGLSLDTPVSYKSLRKTLKNREASSGAGTASKKKLRKWTRVNKYLPPAPEANNNDIGGTENND
jgi:hypothetical protein